LSPSVSLESGSSEPSSRPSTPVTESMSKRGAGKLKGLFSKASDAVRGRDSVDLDRETGTSRNRKDKDKAVVGEGAELLLGRGFDRFVSTRLDFLYLWL
jgi:hypothetical protein